MMMTRRTKLNWWSVVCLGAVSACTNQTTPEGFEGYIVHRPLVFGEAYHVGNQTGPTSTGMVWRQYVANVDMRPKNYSEEFHILSKDNLNVGFHAHGRIGLRAGSVAQVVEKLGAGVLERRSEDTAPIPEWYARNVRQPYRTAVRDVVHEYNAYDIQAQTPEISTRILERLQEDWADTAVLFETISIGNLTYPQEINAEIQRKLAAEQDLERMERERQIARQQAEITITHARGRAAAQRIVNETLTPLYVQHEMLEGMRALAKTDRATLVAAPGDGSPVLINAR